jgi:hypothetical protein
VYRWLRNTHLLLGLFSFLFLVMYGVSAIQMAHRSWFNIKPAVTKTQAAIPQEKATDGRAVARELMDQGVVRGEIEGEVKVTADGYRFTVVRSGTICEVDYSRANGSANVIINTPGLLGMLVRIHHIQRLDHTYMPTNVWSAFLLVVSMALIILAATGIYLWFKLHPERVIGSILLTLSLGYSLTLMVLIRLA